MDSFIPKIQKHKDNFSIWFSKELKILIKQKKVAHDTYKYTNKTKNYTIFSNLRTKCKYSRNRDYALYIENSQNLIKYNPKHFWKFVNDNNTNK
jgi:hypothetical protein